MTDPNCIFCKILAKQIPSERIYEDEYAYAFLDISPFEKGHTLVIPRFHAERLVDLPTEWLLRLMPADTARREDGRQPAREAVATPARTPAPHPAPVSEAAPAPALAAATPPAPTAPSVPAAAAAAPPGQPAPDTPADAAPLASSSNLAAR